MNISVDLTQLTNAARDFVPALRRELRIGLKQSAEILIKQAKTNLDKEFEISRSSSAPNSIQVDDSKTTEDSITVGINIADCPYSIYLHNGTKRHFINPGFLTGNPNADAKALHWVSGGKSFFSGGHWVSGIEKKPFLYNAAKEVKQEIRDLIEMRIQLAFTMTGFK